MCVCVCVDHINRSGPNLKVIHLEKAKCGCRSGKKGIKKGPAPGYKLHKTNTKTIPPESEIQWEKSKRDDNRHKRKRTRIATFDMYVIILSKLDMNCGQLNRESRLIPLS